MESPNDGPKNGVHLRLQPRWRPCSRRGVVASRAAAGERQSTGGAKGTNAMATCWSWRMRSRSSHIIGLASAALILSSCVTMRQGSKQIVPIVSEPDGATVQIEPGGASIVTPDDVALERRYTYSLRFEKQGFQPRTVLIEAKPSRELWRNIVWLHPLGWLAGVLVDLNTGSGYELEPNAVSLTLVPVPSEADPIAPSP